MADPVFIIDGDNVVHVRGRVTDHERSRDALVADVSGWATRAGIQAIVVLDGHGNDRRIGGCQVRYSRRETADTVIERLAYREADGREVTVVSSDTVVRHVSQRGAVNAMSTREFADRLSASAPAGGTESSPGRRVRYQLGDSLDPAVREALERLRRGRQD
ncbi:MAG: NYN domain-containing protein [Gaiellales bacterium]